MNALLITTKMNRKVVEIISHEYLRALAIVLFFVPVLAFSQPAKGTVDYLSYSNGFRGIQLGQEMKDIKGYRMNFLDNISKVDADSCLKYECIPTDSVKTADSLETDLIGIRVFRNKVVNIYVFFKRKDGFNVLSNFLASYGTFTSKPDNYADVYNWDTQSISLSLKYELKVDLGVAIFSSRKDTQQFVELKRRASIMASAPLLSVQ